MLFGKANWERGKVLIRLLLKKQSGLGLPCLSRIWQHTSTVRIFTSFSIFFSQEQVCELYQQLHQSGNPDILETFESVILGVLRDLKQQQLDKERLEKSYKRYP